WRKDLTVLGWAPLGASTWISPSETLAQAREAAEQNGVLPDISLFSGEYRGPLTDRELIERSWNLKAIAAAYREFIARYQPRLEAEQREHSLSEEAAFVEH